MGLEHVTIKQYNVMLSEPKGPGVVRILDTNTSTFIFTSNSKETVYIPEENIQHDPPFNAYSANKTVEVIILILL